MKDKVEELFKSRSKKLGKERKGKQRKAKESKGKESRAIQEVQYLTNRNFKKRTKERGRNHQILN